MISEVRKNSKDLTIAIDQITQIVRRLHPFTREALFDGCTLPLGMRPPELFFRDLALLRRGAQFIASMKPLPPKLNLTKGLSAQQAYAMMSELSKGAIVGTMESNFPRIGTLLFEIVSGKPDASLKRACDAVLSKRRALKPRSSKDEG